MVDLVTPALMSAASVVMRLVKMMCVFFITKEEYNRNPQTSRIIFNYFLQSILGQEKGRKVSPAPTFGFS